ncbi:hypothetical protein ACWDUK_33550 [Streptomyces cellulosae]
MTLDKIARLGEMYYQLLTPLTGTPVPRPQPRPLTAEPPNNTGRTRVFDPSNWSLSAKAAVDGLSDAGV